METVATRLIRRQSGDGRFLDASAVATSGSGASDAVTETHLPATSGTYVLGLHLAQEQEIRIGRLGAFTFPAGWYAYVGSALGGLRARLGRYLRSHRALRWHVDYLLAQAAPGEVWFAVSPERLECSSARRLLTLPGASIPVRRFGASDCRCPAHLVHWPAPPGDDAVARALAGDWPGPWTFAGLP